MRPYSHVTRPSRLRDAREVVGLTLFALFMLGCLAVACIAAALANKP